MATALKGVGHEDRLSLIDHLDELRTRLVICAGTFALAFILCFWQNQALIQVLNDPLENATVSSVTGSGQLSEAPAVGARLGAELQQASDAASGLATDPATPKGQRADFEQLASSLSAAAKDLPKVAPPRQPITTGVGEPFTATLTVSAYFAVLLSLPVILWQLYAFVLPAFNARERRVVLPLMAMVPVLFTAGVAFGYLLVLPPAVNFLQNFNAGSFDILVQAKDYYAFVATVLLALGLIFQVPVGLLALNRAGIVSSAMLVRHWRMIVVGLAVLAALLPGVDPVTTLLEMLPLLVLYGLSILLLKFAEKRDGEDASGTGWALDEHLDDPNAEIERKPERQQVTTKAMSHEHEEDLSD
ncbi:MAG: twin-arginine translocase subunit TatC [Actinomycetes bacterium]